MYHRRESIKQSGGSGMFVRKNGETYLFGSLFELFQHLAGVVSQFRLPECNLNPGLTNVLGILHRVIPDYISHPVAYRSHGPADAVELLELLIQAYDR